MPSPSGYLGREDAAVEPRGQAGMPEVVGMPELDSRGEPLGPRQARQHFPVRGPDEREVRWRDVADAMGRIPESMIRM